MELLTVVAIIGVLSSIGLFSFTSVRKTARDTRRKSELKQYQTAVEVYSVKHDNTYPISNGAITDAFCTNLGLPSCPKDPQTGTLNYMYRSDGAAYVLWAEIEREEVSGGTNYFVICSDGQSGISLTQPSGTTCPTLQ